MTSPGTRHSICVSPGSDRDQDLADRVHFVLSAEQWTEFLAALEAPPREHPRLRRLLSEPTMFDPPESQLDK